MKNEISTVRWILRTSLAWASLRLVLWALVAGIIRVIDPDSFDPGEGPLLMAAILGPMGLFTGVAFGILLAIGSHGIPTLEPSMIRVAGCGILGTASVQLPYLGHGDVGVAANIKMALLFCVAGGMVTMAWLAMARWSSHRRSLPQSSS